MKKELVTLLDGSTCNGDAFDKDDFVKLQDIFNIWLTINKKVTELGGRSLNVPDVFSEALFCLAYNAVRTNGTTHSYDCVTRDSHLGIQVKSASIKPDCTSFGPTSTWDKLYFVDFVPQGPISNGDVWFYEIPSEYIYSQVLNAKTGATFVDQQKAGRRPRFSVETAIINKYNIEVDKKINILTGKGILD